MVGLNNRSLLNFKIMNNIDRFFTNPNKVAHTNIIPPNVLKLFYNTT